MKFIPLTKADKRVMKLLLPPKVSEDGVKVERNIAKTTLIERLRKARNIAAWAKFHSIRDGDAPPSKKYRWTQESKALWLAIDDTISKITVSGPRNSEEHAFQVLLGQPSAGAVYIELTPENIAWISNQMVYEHDAPRIESDQSMKSVEAISANIARLYDKTTGELVGLRAKKVVRNAASSKGMTKVCKIARYGTIEAALEEAQAFLKHDLGGAPSEVDPASSEDASSDRD